MHCVHLCFFYVCFRGKALNTWSILHQEFRSTGFSFLVVFLSLPHTAPMVYLNSSNSTILLSCSLVLCLENNSKRPKSSPQSGQMNILAPVSSSVNTSSPRELPELDNDRELSCFSSQLELVPSACSSRTWLVPYIARMLSVISKLVALSVLLYRRLYLGDIITEEEGQENIFLITSPPCLFLSISSLVLPWPRPAELHYGDH